MIAKIIFLVLLVDAIVANLVAIFGQRWYMHHFQIMARMFPMSKGWTLWYLILVVYIGALTLLPNLF